MDRRGIEETFYAILFFLMVAVAVGWASYCMARLGEPRAKWFWCEMLERC